MHHTLGRDVAWCRDRLVQLFMFRLQHCWHPAQFTGIEIPLEGCSPLSTALPQCPRATPVPHTPTAAVQRKERKMRTHTISQNPLQPIPRATVWAYLAPPQPSTCMPGL